MTDSMELILQVCPAPGDDAGELAGWLRGELLDLDVEGADRLPGEAVPAGSKGSADIAGLLLVQHPKALLAVLARVSAWVARSGRMVEISAGGHTLKLAPPTRQQQEKVIHGAPVPGTEVSRVQPEDETGAVIEVTPSVVGHHDSPAEKPGTALTLREIPPLVRQSLEEIRQSLGERGELSRRDRPADTRPVVRRRFNIEALPGQEFSRTAAFALALSLLGCGLVILLLIAILAVSKLHHGFSISTNYPVHRVYREIVRYFARITPPPGSSHMLLVYSVYLAVLPVLFTVVFMHLKVGSTRLVVATLACAVFMAAPFIIVITSIRVGSANCGSWNYPELNSGSECYNALTIAFRIAFAVGIAGIAIPIIYLIRGRLYGLGNSLLLRVLVIPVSTVAIVFTLIAITVLHFIGHLVRRPARGGRDVAPDQVRFPE